MHGTAEDLTGVVTPAETAPRSYRMLAAAAVLLAAAGVTGWLLASRQPAHVSEALATGQIPLPAFLSELNPPHDAAGTTQSSGSDIITPIGTAVRSRRPTFEWQPVPLAVGYQVQLLSLDGKVAAQSGNVPGTTWQATSDLAPDTTYQWQVAVTIPGSKAASVLPAVPARFRILDEASAKRMENLPAANLERGVEEARAGLMEDARRDISAAIVKRPYDPDIRRLLRFLAR